MNQETNMNEIHGSGGGGKGGGGQTFREDENTLRSNVIVSTVEAWGEGPVVGPVLGAKSIFLDNTPLQNADGTFNFGGKIGFAIRTGLPDQTEVPGFEETSDPITVNTEIVFATPVVRTVTDAEVSTVGLTISMPQGLYNQDTSNNALTATQVELAVDVKLSASGTWTQQRVISYNDKTTSPYQETFRIDRPSGTGLWDIRVRRLTPDNASSTLRNNTFWAYHTEMQLLGVTYPDIAYMAVTVDAASVNSSQIPKRSAEIYGLIVQVPSNYNEATRVYSGVWNGTFKNAWTNDPAWVLYAICTNTRWGLGLDPSQVDKFSFYEASVYNSELLSFTNKVGTTSIAPRFSFNYQIDQGQIAPEMLNQVASVMNAKVMWVGGQITVLQDRPEPVAHMFTRASMVGLPVYKGTALQQRNTVANVTWNDPGSQYQQRVVSVEDAEYLASYGYNPVNVAAYGCTNEAQAIRFGKWYLYTVLRTSEMVTFTVGIEGQLVVPHEIIEIYDNDYTGQAASGRVKTGCTTTSIVLDRTVNLSADAKIDIAYPDGTMVFDQNIVTTGNASTITLNTALAVAPPEYSQFIIKTNSVEPRQFRVSKVTALDNGQYRIEANQYDNSKYAFVETGVAMPSPVFSAIRPNTVNPPTSLFLTERVIYIDNKISRSLTASWSAPNNVDLITRYQVTYRINGGELITVSVPTTFYEIEGVVPGVTEVRVYAVSFRDVLSIPLVGRYTVEATEVTGSTLDAPTTLQVVGGGTTFSGRALTFEWTNPSSNGVGDVSVSDFKVEIYTTADVLLRTEYVAQVAPGNTQSFSYDYDKNLVDGGPRRSVKVKVYARDGNKKLSGAATATFSNPAPAALSSFTATGGIGNMLLEWLKPLDTDLVGVLVWRGSTNTFTPDSDNLVGDTTGTGLLNGGLTASTPYYYKAAAYDAFSRPTDGAGLNISLAMGDTLTLASAGIPSGATTPADGSGVEGDLFFNTTDGKLYRYHAGVWTTAVPTVDLVGTITSTQLGIETVQAVNIAPAAVTTVKIDAQAVTTAKLDDAAVTGVKLADSAVTGVKLADAAVTGVKIDVGAVGSVNIASNAVTTAKIEDAAISAIKLANEAVTTGKIAPLAITTEKIEALAITTAKIADLGITTGKIADFAIGTGKIQDASVTNVKLVANSITADKIAAGAITANAINVIAGGGNYLRNSSFESDALNWLSGAGAADGIPDYYEFFTVGSDAFGTPNSFYTRAGLTVPSGLTVTTATPGRASASCMNLAGAGTWNIGQRYESLNDGDGEFDWIPGTYYVSIYARVPGGSPVVFSGGSWSSIVVPLLFSSEDTSPTVVSGPARTVAGEFVRVDQTSIADLILSGVTPSLDDWHRVVFKFVVPTPTSVTKHDLIVRCSVATSIQLDDIQLEYGEVATAYAPMTDEILPGTVNTVKLAASAVTAEKIAANAVTADKIIANAISSDKIAANAITADKIGANEITGDKIVGSTITGDKIAANTLTAANIAANTITSAEIAANAITTDKLVAGAVVASKLTLTDLTNYVANGSFANGTAEWTQLVGTGFSVVNTGSVTAPPTFFYGKIDPAASFEIVRNNPSFDVNFNEKLRLKFQAAVGSGTHTGGSLGVAVQFAKSDGTTAGLGYAVLQMVTGLTTTWQEFSYNFDPPTDATSAYLYFQSNGGSFGDTADVFISKFELRKQNAAELVVDGGITTGKIAALAITTDKIDALAVNADKIAANSITSVKIAADAITADKIAANAVTADEIAANAITTVKLDASAVTADKIAANAITTVKLDASAVTADKIAANAITTVKLDASAVTADKIAANAIEADKIAANAVTTVKLAANAVEADKIAANAITTAKLDALAVTADKIAADAIEANKIAANAITSVKIAADAITTDKIAANAVTADEIAANAITTVKLAANAVEADKIAANAITSDKILANAVTAGKILAGAIEADKLAVNSVTSDKIVANTIVAGNIADATITNAKLVDSTITGAKIADSTITNAKIGGALFSDTFNGTITGGVITANGTAGWAIDKNGKQVLDATVYRNNKASAAQARGYIYDGAAAVSSTSGGRGFAALTMPAEGVAQTGANGYLTVYIRSASARRMEVAFWIRATDGTTTIDIPAVISSHHLQGGEVWTAVSPTVYVYRIPVSMNWLYSGEYYVSTGTLRPGTAGILPAPTLVNNKLTAGSWGFSLQTSLELYDMSDNLASEIDYVTMAAAGYAMEHRGVQTYTPPSPFI